VFFLCYLPLALVALHARSLALLVSAELLFFALQVRSPAPAGSVAPPPPAARGAMGRPPASNSTDVRRVHLVRKEGREVSS
jgi:hypothetical protein